MNMKLLATTALAASLISGMAFAQSTPDAKGQVGASTTSESNDSTTANTDAKSDSMQKDSMKSDDAMGSHQYTSDDERSMYEKMGDSMAGFFTDDSMTEMKSDDQIKETFAAAGAENQSQIKAACDRVKGDRGSYGTVTIGLCEKIGAL